MHTNLQRPQRLFAQPVRYEIPAFQRRYVWKQEEQWEPLWNDIEELAQSILEDGQTEPHFMGAVVLQQMQYPAGTIERRIVVDGQQRLTTLQLLIDAIQEVLEGRGHSDPAKRLAALVDNQEEFRDGDADNAFKVWPTVIDRDAFRQAMRNDLTSDDHTESRIVQAHNYFKEQTARWLSGFSNEGGKRDRAASALESAVRANVELVVIDLDDNDDPHVIFETLNARGTPLLQSDMIKNKVLHDANVKAYDERSVSLAQRELWPFEEDWWMQEVGRGLQRRPRIDMYLNHWLALRTQGEVRNYDEFRAFESYSNQRLAIGKSISDVAADFGEIGKVYRDIEDVRRKDIAEFLTRRNVMNITAVTPLLLWLLSNNDLQPPALENCLRALESYLMRRVVCGYGAKSYGNFFVALIEKLAASPIDSVDRTLVSNLAAQTGQATLWPNDMELQDRFVTAPLYQWLTRGRLRMLLTAIEGQLRTEKAETSEVPGNLHIEHIMPQKWSAKWTPPMGGDGDAVAHRERAIHTIGNLTLVNNRLNAALSNAPWHEKRGTLADHSVLFLNKHLVNDEPSTWNEDTIERRGEWLYQIAARIWPHCVENVDEFLVDLARAPVLPGRMDVSPEAKQPEHTGELSTSSFDVAATSQYGTESAAALRISSNETRNKNGESLQEIVRDLMLTVLERFPGTLDAETIRQLEVTKNPLGLNISGHTLLRDVSVGRLVGRHNRYWNRVYGGRWYVCSQWWAHAHGHNAETLANWVDRLCADVGQNEVFGSLSDIRKRLDGFRDSL